MICQNRHKMIINYKDGLIKDRPCINKATKHIADNWGILYLCEKCYKDDCQRRINIDHYSLKEKCV